MCLTNYIRLVSFVEKKRLLGCKRCIDLFKQKFEKSDGVFELIASDAFSLLFLSADFTLSLSTTFFNHIILVTILFSNLKTSSMRVATKTWRCSDRCNSGFTTEPCIKLQGGFFIPAQKQFALKSLSLPDFWRRFFSTVHLYRLQSDRISVKFF